MSTVSENLKYLRKLKGYTQEQFAAQIGIKRSLVGAYEEARANPNEIYLDSMAEVLGVSVEHLLNENLKERARRLGTGNILKLNTAAATTQTVAPKKLSNPIPTSEKSSPIQSPGPVNKEQMDLFEEGIANERELKFRPKPEQEVKLPGTSPVKDVREQKSSPELPKSGLVEILATLLATQSDLRIFSNPDDLPLKDQHLIGQRVAQIESISQGELCILRTRDEETWVRRVFSQLETKGTLILSSDFPGKQILELPKYQIVEVYRFLGSIQTSAPVATVSTRKLRELNDEISSLLASL